MSEDSSGPDLPKDSGSADLDLRGLKAAEARSRAFSGMFRFKPGQRISILVDGGDAEKEIMRWIDEIGHRFLKAGTIEERGKTFRSLEVVKMEARR